MKLQNIFLFVLVCALLYACGSSKPITKKLTSKDETLPEIESKIVFNPKTGRYDTIYASAKIDTMRWKPAPTKTTPPIGGSSTTGTTKPNKPTKPTGNLPSVVDVKAPKNSVFRSTYHLTYALPFYTDKFTELDKELYEKSDWALNFYAGAKMALDTLSSDGISLKINTVDTKANETEMAILLSSDEVQKADVIIGAETRKNVEATAIWAKQNGKVFISPYNPSNDIVFDNQQFMQLNPSLQTHCEALTNHALKNNRADNIVVIVRDKANEREAMQYIQWANQKAGNGVRFREIVIDEKAGMVAVDVRNYIRANENTTFIIPIWNSETFIYSLLTKINNAKGRNNVIVYGMPQWANFQVNGFDAFDPLKVHITQSAYIDRDSPRAKGFARAFYQRYNASPDDEAYQGYGITLYAGRMLYKYGTKFNEIADMVPFQSIETIYNFQKEKSMSSNSERFDAFDRYANKYLTILKFENGFFQKTE
jgi:hypothetical protein